MRSRWDIKSLCGKMSHSSAGSRFCCLEKLYVFLFFVPRVGLSTEESTNSDTRAYLANEVACMD